MALKLTITADEHKALDDALKGLYAKDGDGYALAIEGRSKDHRAALDARDEARRERDAIRQKFDGIDPEGYKNLRAELAAAKKAAADAAGAKQTDAEKVQSQLDALTKKLAAETDARKAAEARAVQQERQTAFAAAASKAGIRPGLTTDMLWGATAPKVEVGADGAMTVAGAPVAEHLAGLKDAEPHLFAESNGAGVNGGGGKPGAPGLTYSQDTHDQFQEMSAEQLAKYAEENAGKLMG